MPYIHLLKSLLAIIIFNYAVNGQELNNSNRTKSLELISGVKPYNFYSVYNAYSNSGNLLAISGRNDSSVSIIDLNSSSVLQQFATHYTLFNLFFSGDSILFAVGRDLKKQNENTDYDLKFYLLKFNLENNKSIVVRTFYNNFFSPIIISQENIMVFYSTDIKENKLVKSSDKFGDDDSYESALEIYNPADNKTIKKLKDPEKLQNISSISIIGTKLYIHRSIPRSMPQNDEELDIWDYKTEVWENELNYSTHQNNTSDLRVIASSPNGELMLYNERKPAKKYTYQSERSKLYDFTTNYFLLNKDGETLQNFYKLPIQYTLPWFYNDSILVLEYDTVIRMINVYESFEITYSPIYFHDYNPLISENNEKSSNDTTRKLIRIMITKNGNYLLGFYLNGEVAIRRLRPR